VPNSPVAKVVERLRNTLLREEEDSLSDGQLLDRYLENRDETAFAALVRRHGAMVWSVCRRIVGHTDDAEDAFQAAFLILVRKAFAVKPREAVGNWLYGVACHTAMKARAASARVHAKEKQVATMPEPGKDRSDDREELQKLLDQELSALPDKYRLPVVLCDLTGRTRKDVAAQLKIPEGTLSSRLATAHQMLAKRLARHGLVVSGGSLAALLVPNATSAGVPTSVVASTILAATLVAASKGAVAGVVSTKVAALTDGVMKAMLLSKLKVAIAPILLLGLVAAGGTFLSDHMQPALSQSPKKAAPAQAVTATKSRVETLAFMRLLETPIDTKGFQEKAKLRHVLEVFSDMFQGELPILVDKGAFLAGAADDPDVYEEEVSLPPVPARMRMDLALRCIVAQVGKGEATYVVRGDFVEITTKEASRAVHSLPRLGIVGSYKKRPLVEVLQELSDKVWVVFNLDPNLEARLNTPTTVTFNNCSLEEALVTISEMATIGYVVLDHSIYITTPDRAKAMQQEEDSRRKKREADAKKPLRGVVGP
jgi:RNA polymerase sigma factor (sigma-70 family)